MPSDLMSLRLAGVIPTPANKALRRLDPARTDELAAAYFNAYPAGVACNTLNEAVEEIRETFAGEFGRLRTDASSMVVHEGRVVGAVLVVDRSVWDADLPGPFIIDLFVDPTAQGVGWGRALVQHAIGQAAAAGDELISLRVGEGTSVAAHALYGSLGFVSR